MCCPVHARRIVGIGLFWGIMTLTGFGQSSTRPFIEGIRSWQVFPHNPSFEAIIPFGVDRQGLLSVEVIRQSDRNMVVQQRWEILPSDSQFAATQFTEEGGLIRTTSRTLSLEKIPLGGPYTIRFNSKGDVNVYDNILVGEIWVVGGGPNSIGAPGKPRGPYEMVHLFRNGSWQEGRDPVIAWHDPATWETLPENQGPVSPWLEAAKTYWETTNIPVGIIGLAFPERSILDMWEQVRTPGTRQMTYELIGFKKMVEEQGQGASVFGWYHGEADATLTGQSFYGQQLAAVVAAMRRYAGNPAMTAMIVQLSYRDHPDGKGTPYFGRIREIQRQYCLLDSRSTMVSALPYTHRDSVHLDEDGVLKLGASIGRALLDIQPGKPIPWQGPRIVSAAFADFERRRIVVTFDSAQTLNLLREPRLHWHVTDGANQGYPEAGVPLFDTAGNLALHVAGGLLENVQVAADKRSLTARLAQSGYVNVTGVTQLGALSLQVDLNQAALPGARISYGMPEDCRGSLRGDDGKPAAAFVDVPVGEPETPGARGTPAPPAVNPKIR